MRFSKVAHAQLFLSTPNPSWFGNGANAPRAVGWDAENWLTSRFHFSFAEWNDAKRAQYGCLRVLNDDRVQPARGFGTHGHANMEIVTYIVEGELTHQDSMGTAETLGRGAVQFMTAGSGVRHSEYNHSPDTPLRFIQMWIMPRSRGLKPNYGSASFAPDARRNRWAHLVGDVDAKDARVAINQDANIFATEFDAGGKLPFALGARRQAYMVCLEGSVSLTHAGGSAQLDKHEACEVGGEVGGEQAFEVVAGPAGAHCILIEMAAAA